MSIAQLESIVSSVFYRIDFSWFHSTHFLVLLAVLWIILFKKMGFFKSLVAAAITGIIMSNLWIWLAKDKTFVSVLAFFVISSMVVIYYVYIYTLKEE